MHQCEGITRTGDKCTRVPKANNNYCWQHEKRLLKKINQLLRNPILQTILAIVGIILAIIFYKRGTPPVIIKSNPRVLYLDAKHIPSNYVMDESSLLSEEHVFKLIVAPAPNESEDLFYVIGNHNDDKMFILVNKSGAETNKRWIKILLENPFSELGRIWADDLDSDGTYELIYTTCSGNACIQSIEIYRFSSDVYYKIFVAGSCGVASVDKFIEFKDKNSDAIKELIVSTSLMDVEITGTRTIPDTLTLYLNHDKTRYECEEQYDEEDGES